MMIDMVIGYTQYMPKGVRDPYKGGHRGGNDYDDETGETILRGA